MESGNGGINGKSDKIITIDAGEITGGKYISFPKSFLEGNCYTFICKIIYHMTCDHVITIAVSNWLSQAVTVLKTYCC